MQAQHIFVFLTLCAIPAFAQSLLAVLQENGFTEYAERLQGDPILSAGPGLIVYTPTNAALVGNGNVTVTRRQDAGSDNSAENSYGCVNATAPRWVDPAEFEGDSGAGNATLRKKQVGPSGSVYGTLLDDPEWVNLGPGRNQTIVEKRVPTASLPLVFTGLGASVGVAASDIPFEGGIIRPINGVLTLPRNLSYTLPFLSAERFGAALQNAGLFPDLDNRAIITVFAPNDAAFGDANNLPDAQLAQLLREHVVVGFPAYTPLLVGGRTYRTLGGSDVTVSIRDGVAYINGARILAGDAIIKNGVVHTIDRLLTTQSPTTPPSSIPTAAATTAKSLSWLAFVFTFVGIAVAALPSV
ncbi:hypothetical protein DL764_010672 [Monosporascus ibericus]|uniref:FAS1 domain-containing protein n=1 Tax=Monosporascus ibericus TaxID=155417 RepID=A0A4Q4SUT5_9PEZI|nr:hypothetical protein DL764_010672 [Monosporascus ibericus]